MRRLLLVLTCSVIAMAGCGSSKSTVQSAATSTTIAPSTTTTAAPARVSVSGKQFTASLAPGWTDQSVPLKDVPDGLEMIEAANVQLQWNDDGSIKGDTPKGAIAILSAHGPLSAVPSDSGDPATISLSDLADLTTGIESTATDVHEVSVDHAARLDGEPAYAFAMGYHDNGRSSFDYNISARHAGYFYEVGATAESLADAKAALNDFIANWHWK